MAEVENELTTKQQRAIVSLMMCPTIATAAKHCKVGERTLYRWMKEPTFAAELRTAETNAMSGAVRMLTSTMGSAAVVLKHIMATGTPALKLRAALGLVGALPGLRQLVDLDERIAALEAAMVKK